jgi:multidrug resistance efflux pump
MVAVAQAWLDSQCGALNGVAGAMVLLLTSNGRALVPAAAWPRGEINPGLAAAAKTAFEQQRPTVSKINETTAEGPMAIVSHPLAARGQPVGAVALAVKSDEANVARTTLEHLARSAAAFSNAAEASSAEGGNTAPLMLQLIATVLAHDKFANAATALASELAARLRCERVSVGVSNARYMEVVALSHSGELSKDESLLRDLGAAMDEAAAQNTVIQYPQSQRDKPRITLQHSDLAKRQQATAIVTTPLISDSRCFGAICYEFAEEHHVDANTFKLTEDIAAFVTPLLVLKHAHERATVDRALGKAKRVAGKLLGEGHVGFKLGALAITVLAAALAFVPAQFYVSAEARVEGAIQRALVAPTDGYLKEAHVRPADRVKAGQLLAELADEDLKLNRRKWQSEFAQAESAYGEALAKQDRGQVVVQQARMEEARAQLELTEQEIGRSQVVAPFDGVIIKGDLTQSLGAPVKRGDQLLTLAPSDAYRVILEVDERDVAYLAAGNHGALALSALPGEALNIQVVRVTPVARSEQGRHYFEVEAALTQDASKLLRPGLRGVAKVPAGERSVLSSWTRRAVDSIRLLLWSWFG